MKAQVMRLCIMLEIKMFDEGEKKIKKNEIQIDKTPFVHSQQKYKNSVDVF